MRVAKERIASKSVVVFGVPEEQKENEDFKVKMFYTSWTRNSAPKTATESFEVSLGCQSQYNSRLPTQVHFIRS